MKIADQCRPTGTRGAVRGDQSGRIDLEMMRRIWCHIGAFLRQGDMISMAEQEPACLKRVRPRRCVEHGGKGGGG